MKITSWNSSHIWGGYLKELANEKAIEKGNNIPYKTVYKRYNANTSRFKGRRDYYREKRLDKGYRKIINTMMIAVFKEKDNSFTQQLKDTHCVSRKIKNDTVQRLIALKTNEEQDIGDVVRQLIQNLNSIERIFALGNEDSPISDEFLDFQRYKELKAAAIRRSISGNGSRSVSIERRSYKIIEMMKYYLEFKTIDEVINFLIIYSHGKNNNN